MPDERHIDLPSLAEIFDKLRLGWHICRLDGNLYWLLEKHGDAYTEIFAQLGFRLEKHSREFYYFVDSRNFSPTAQKMALFVFILVDSIAGRGQPVEETVMTDTFRYDELPHLQTERYRTMMKEAEVGSEEDLAKLVGTLERFGFAERMDDSCFRFRPPAYRFLDLCQEVLSEDVAP